MAVVTFPARNKLAYPAGIKAGFDPNHVASKNMRPGRGLLAIANSSFQSGNMVNLLTGRTADAVPGGGNTPSTWVDGLVGPVVIGNGAHSNTYTFSGNAAVVDTGQTLAGIISYRSAHTDSPVLVGSGSTYPNSWYLYADGATKQLGAYTASAALSGLVLNNNEAYFVAASNDGSNLYFIVKSLTTGSVRAATVTGTSGSNATSFTSSGTYTVQSDTFTNQVVFPIAAVSYTPAFLPLSQLRQFADEPWAFWYPPKARMRVATAAAGGSFLAAWAQQSNLPVLGTGTY